MSAPEAQRGVADAWLLFDLHGLTEDLLPVPQPGIPPSPRSAVKQPGKVPGTVNREGQAIGFPQWTQHRSTGEEIAQWSREGRLGVCLQTRRARAIDIDVDDAARATAIERFVAEELGFALPCRTRANSAKRLLLVIADGELPKRTVPVDGGVIELLGNGQQAVIAGMHPSGVPYEWRGGLPDRIPEVALADYTRLIARIEERFATSAPTGGVLRQRGETMADLPQPEGDWLAEHWEVRGEACGGMYVRCPNEAEHTVESGPSEAIWLYAGGNGYERGHFRCQHAHCAEIGRAQFLEMVGYTAARAEDFPDLGDAPAMSTPPAGAISATPYSWPEPHLIPKRRWLYGHQLLRGALALLVAPGGTGKTALTVGMALSISTGRALLGKEVPEGPHRVWLWNLEDARDELDRAIAAACQHHAIEPNQVASRLFVDSGLSGVGLCTAIQTREGCTLRQPIYDALLAEIRTRGIDVLIVDPFVSSHAVSENDNGAIDAVAKAWAKVAAAADCAILLVHHTSKAAGVEITSEKSRGASALVNAARSVVALNRMTAEEARKLGVSEADGRRCFRAFDDKNNRAPPAEASDWFRLESATLPNGDGDECFGDSVAVVVPWTPPAASVAALDPVLTANLQTLIAESEWRESDRAAKWAGKAVAQVFGLDVDDPFGKTKIKAIIKEGLRKGWLRTEDRRDDHRVTKTWIVAGELIEQPGLGVQQCSSSAALHVAADRCAVQRCSALPLGSAAAAAQQLAVAGTD